MSITEIKVISKYKLTQELSQYFNTRLLRDKFIFSLLVLKDKVEILDKTRLHFSRMRTACALTVSPSMLWARGGVSASRGVGVCFLGVVCSGGGYPSMH